MLFRPLLLGFYCDRDKIVLARLNHWGIGYYRGEGFQFWQKRNHHIMAKFFGTLLTIAVLFFVAHAADAGQSIVRLANAIEHYQPKIKPALHKSCQTDSHGTTVCVENFGVFTEPGSPNPYNDKFHKQCDSGEWYDIRKDIC
jgi:hypothetical protein